MEERIVPTLTKCASWCTRRRTVVTCSFSTHLPRGAALNPELFTVKWVCVRKWEVREWGVWNMRMSHSADITDDVVLTFYLTSPSSHPSFLVTWVLYQCLVSYLLTVTPSHYHPHPISFLHTCPFSQVAQCSDTVVNSLPNTNAAKLVGHHSEGVCVHVCFWMCVRMGVSVSGCEKDMSPCKVG